MIKFNPEKHYYGTVCKRGHTTRYISCGACVQCQQENQVRRYRENPGKFSKRAALVYKKHGERIRAQQAEYRALNMDKVKARGRKYYKNNLDQASRRRHKRRARMASVRSELYSREDILSMYPYCLRCLSNESLALDHVVPISRGGPNVVENIQVLCKVCNSRKRDAYLECRPSHLLNCGTREISE